MPIVAIGDEFLDAFARIPRSQQKKVREFTEKFKENPSSSSINYEKIHNVRDPKVRTVRIDQKYRAIVLHPDEGEVYVLVWVDNHDEAMAWAANRVFEVNPYKGSLQIVNVREVQEALPQKRTRRGGIFENSDDAQLLSFGIPEILLPAVRGIKDKQELQVLIKHLPAEAAEALVWLAEGIPVDEIREAVAAAPAKVKVDTDDLTAALQHPDSRRRFVIVQTDSDLNAMLDAPLEKWRIFLHPSQERLVSRNFNGPAKVLGGAGTGKTVVAMHRARHLAKTICTEPEDRILFTTYTANLAQNVDQNLTNLCGPEKDKIEVVHIHAWAARFMKKHGVEFKIATNEEIDGCWERAILEAEDLSFDLGFLKKEWEQVFQSNGLKGRADYLSVSRAGRGQTLNRLQRSQVWKIFANFMNEMKAIGKREWLNVIQDTRRFIEQKKPALPYRSVIVDEAQDFHTEEWKLINAIAPDSANNLLLAGDAHQRIYGNRISLRRCGINIQGRSSRLKINYRTTEQIREWAMGVLRGVEFDDLENNIDSEKGYRSLLSGPDPEYMNFKNAQQELKFIGKRVRELLKDRQPEDICIVARSSRMLRESYHPLFKEAGLTSTLLEKSSEGKGIRLATMHRVKGLEFPVMIIAGVNAGTVPLKSSSVGSDPVAISEHEDKEKSLLFVAATRARDLLIITSYGEPSPFLLKSSGIEP